VSERARSADRWLVLWAGLCAILLLAPPSLVPSLGAAGESNLDKLGHLLLFLVLAALAVAPARGRTRHPLTVVVLGGIAYGALLEVLQGALGWRSAELADLAADGVGSLVGVLVPVLRGRA
jgi:VanZ family protein